MERNLGNILCLDFPTFSAYQLREAIASALTPNTTLREGARRAYHIYAMGYKGRGSAGVRRQTAGHISDAPPARYIERCLSKRCLSKFLVVVQCCVGCCSSLFGPSTDWLELAASLRGNFSAFATPVQTYGFVVAHCLDILATLTVLVGSRLASQPASRACVSHVGRGLSLALSFSLFLCADLCSRVELWILPRPSYYYYDWKRKVEGDDKRGC